MDHELFAWRWLTNKFIRMWCQELTCHCAHFLGSMCIVRLGIVITITAVRVQLHVAKMVLCRAIQIPTSPSKVTTHVSTQPSLVIPSRQPLTSPTRILEDSYVRLKGLDSQQPLAHRLKPLHMRESQAPRQRQNSKNWKT